MAGIREEVHEEGQEEGKNEDKKERQVENHFIIQHFWPPLHRTIYTA